MRIVALFRIEPIARRPFGERGRASTRVPDR
jgi:hypothetical protein